MTVVHNLCRIKQMLCNESNVVYPTSIQVSSYCHVIERWVQFKTFKNLKFDTRLNIIRDIFRFHRSDTDHIVLYYSKNMQDCLLMCRIKGNYVNLLIPANGIIELNRNIIATYT